MSECIFCKIINGEIPSKKVLENDKFYAFHDIQPVKKVHVLIVPKNHVSNIAHLNEKNADYVEGLLPFVRDVAKELGISKDGYRLIFNTGENCIPYACTPFRWRRNGLARSLILSIMYSFYNTL